jgi:hypothetical protein
MTEFDALETRARALHLEAVELERIMHQPRTPLEQRHFLPRLVRTKAALDKLLRQFEELARNE